METLFLLYLAHFLGDYPFQTNWIYLQKEKSPWLGSLYHLAGIFLALLLCLAPFLNIANFWLAIVLITIFHYLQDALKIEYFLSKKWRNFGYFFDQVTHLLVIYVIWSLLLANTAYQTLFLPIFYNNLALILYLLGLIFVTYFMDISYKVLYNEPFKKRNWHLMLINSIIYSAIYYTIWLYI